MHPAGHLDWVLLDFGNPEYQAAWAQRVADNVEADGWTGVEVVDASNLPQWSQPPLDPRTGQEMSEDDRRRYLAEALALVRAAMKTRGFSLIAVNDPPVVVDLAQIGSTDGVSVGEGFARLRGAAWQQLFDYFQAAVEVEVGAWVWDGDRGLTRDQRLYGLASYLLVSSRLSAYGAPSHPSDPLYAIDLGEPLDVTRAEGPVRLREFDRGLVAVNPGEVAADVTLSGHGDVRLPPGGAVIAGPDGVFQSG